MLPEDLRSQLNAWWGIDRDGAGYRNTVARVHAWVHKTFAAAEERRDPGKWERLRRFVHDRDDARARRRAAPADPQAPDSERDDSAKRFALLELDGGGK
jgi:hypothetical protein